MPIIPKDQLKALIKEYNLKDPTDIQEMLKKLFGDTLQEMLEACFLQVKIPHFCKYFSPGTGGEFFR